MGEGVDVAVKDVGMWRLAQQGEQVPHLGEVVHYSMLDAACSGRVCMCVGRRGVT